MERRTITWVATAMIILDLRRDGSGYFKGPAIVPGELIPNADTEGSLTLSGL
jgi:hypothetical protein